MDRTLSPIVEKLLTRTRLTVAEQEALLALAGRRERLDAQKRFVLLGDAMTSVCFVLEGLCARIEVPSDNRRQITAFYLPGDMPDLYSAFIAQATASLEAMTSAVIIRVPHAAIHRIMNAYPGIAEAFTRYLVADAAISAEWIANVGGRDARSAVSHLYCEMAVRNAQVKGNEFSFYLPLTQTSLGEATGLSAVHINRTLTALRIAGIMLVEKSVVHVLDWDALRTLAEFDSGYLVSKGQARFAPEPVAAR